MSPPWTKTDVPPSNHPFDRLVDGSLSEAERRALLLRLEAEPDGWRRCALAFLEAQMWREAFAPLAAAAPVSTAPAAKPVPWRRMASAAAVAACVAGAFVLGWTMKPPEILRPHHEMAQVSPSTPSAPPPVVVEAPGNVDTPPAAAALEPRNAVVESMVKVWQRAGYSAERQPTHVTMKLRDGRALEVPAQEITLRYTADRTY